MPATLTSQSPLANEPFGQTGVRQYLFPALTVLSLTCMVLSLGMWVRSHYIVDRFSTRTAKSTWYVSSIYGRVLVAWGEDSPQPAPRGEWQYMQSPIPDVINDKWRPSVWKMIGFEWRGQPYDSTWGDEGGWLRARWPFIAALWGVLPVVRVVRERRRKREIDRLLRGQCPRCGYDLRAAANRCPECGTVPLELQA